MTRTFALSLKRPHETLGVPMPVGRRLAHAGRASWFAAFACIICSCIGVYIYQVNVASSQGFRLRTLQVQADHLHNEVAVLETTTAEMQTLHAIQERIKPFGYVPVDQMEFLNINQNTFAMR